MESPVISSSLEITLSSYEEKISLSQIDENEVLFSSLADDWRKESELLSSTQDIINCPSYQKIIGMGRVAVPFIIRELQKGKGYGLGHWSHALEVLTGENPVRHAQKGNIRAIADAWLEWAENKYER